mmetsp:Transcript_75814/g.195366  ORF Transcript_75814/g.195366 Transcript_75814/m.195366 type:complete len:207 (+) Transcript_75814:408-1028(+)
MLGMLLPYVVILGGGVILTVGAGGVIGTDRCLEALPSGEAHTPPLARSSLDVFQDREVCDVLELKGGLHLREMYMLRKESIQRDIVGDLASAQLVHGVRRLRRQEGDAFPEDLLLVKSALVDHPVGGQGDQHDQHHRRDEGQVVGTPADEHHDSDAHLLEASKHPGAAQHGVDAGGGEALHAVVAEPSTHDAAQHPADEHGAREVA